MTIFEGVPTMYAAILHLRGRRAAAKAATLRTCISGGASLPVEVLRGFEEKFGCMILEGYGLSETSPVASFNLPDIERKPGSIGVPSRACEMRLGRRRRASGAGRGVGEIAIRGHNVMKGYWNSPRPPPRRSPAAGSAPGTWPGRTRTATSTIVDRKKDLIIRGGFNVYPREIEEVLHEHPAVAEVAVIGLPHPDLGEEVGAAVALKPGAAATPEELRAFVPGQGGGVQVPAARLAGGRAAQGPDREDPAPRGETAAGAGARRGPRPAVTETPPEPPWTEDAVDAAGGLDLLLTDAALGLWHRLRRTARCSGWPPGWPAARSWQSLRRPGSAPSSPGCAVRPVRPGGRPAGPPVLRSGLDRRSAAAPQRPGLPGGGPVGRGAGGGRELGWRDDTRVGSCSAT